ncbi:MAG: YceI family protein [Thermoanaerobaculia bacterium]|nr:YceI family protein [Thermoanaerobaculia bacterium]
MRRFLQITFTASFALAVLLLGLVALPSVAADGDAPGTLEWRADSDRYQAHGRFDSWHFTEIDIPDGDLETGSVTFVVDLASVWEKAEDLANHLRQADFFNVAKFATSTVKIHGAEKQADGSFSATATIDLHGVTKDVLVTFRVVTEAPLKIEGEATLSRLAFGVGEAGSISDEVRINLSATVEK